MRLSSSSLSIFILFLSKFSTSLFFAVATNVGGGEESSSNTKDVNESMEEEEVEDMIGSALDPHPDPNEENYEGMIYIGRHEDNGKRMGFDKNNGMSF